MKKLLMIMMLALTLTTHARIGYSIDELKNRYGKPTTEKHKTKKHCTFTFLSKSLEITTESYNGKCFAIQIKVLKTMNEIPLEFFTNVVNNHLGGKWEHTRKSKFTRNSARYFEDVVEFYNEDLGSIDNSKYFVFSVLLKNKQSAVSITDIGLSEESLRYLDYLEKRVIK